MAINKPSDGVFGFGVNVDIFILVCCIILIIFLILYFRSKNGMFEYFYDAIPKEPKIIKHSFGDYEVLEIFDLLTPNECKQLIAYAKKKGLNDSDVLSYGTSSGTEVNSDYRKSKTSWVYDSEHPIVMKIAQYSQQITGIPIENQEMLQIAQYEPNGKFNEHFDACVYNDKQYCEKMNNYAGQRRSTLLVYLNDDFTGGETEFVDIGLKIKPEQGKAILFWNVDENENLMLKSKHRGNPVLKGEKWICTKWSHVRPYGK